jgi:hypothetical protein
VDRGLIARVTDPADRRGVLLSLTADGRAMQRRIGGGHAVGVSRAVNDRLTPAVQRQLERLCRKLAGLPPVEGSGRSSDIADKTGTSDGTRKVKRNVDQSRVNKGKVNKSKVNNDKVNKSKEVAL